MLLKVIKFLKNNWIIVLITLLAFFLRFYRITDYMTFLGDEGRDAIVWLRMIRDHKLTLIGPTTSIGNMYLGPLYYYLMLPFYVIFGSNPVGAAMGVALFSVMTVILIWYFGKIWLNERIGLIAAFFYAISPLVLQYSRSSWNPNVMPFFALITIWGIWQFWQKNNYLWIGLIGISLSFAVQSHYLGLLLLPVIGIFWLVKLLDLIAKKLLIRKFLFFTFMGGLIFLILSVLPLVWFDLRHNFINYNAFLNFFTQRQTTVNLKIYKAFPLIFPLGDTLITRLLVINQTILGGILAIILALVLVWKTIKSEKPAILIFAWLILGLLGLGLYKQHIYDHYFGFLYPAVFLLLGLVFDSLWKMKIVGKLTAAIVFIVILFSSISNNLLLNEPNLQYVRTKEIANAITQDISLNKINFNIVSLVPYNDYRAMSYRYFLDANNLTILSYENYQDANLLYVVVDDYSKNKDPLSTDIWELKTFGEAVIEKEWQFPWGVRLYKLARQK
jgi:4-amino-4-deoxy-L-arabinose transferase-like glycosyltransferase